MATKTKTMIDISKAMRNDRLMKAVTGLKVHSFNALLPSFTKAFEAYCNKLGLRVALGRGHTLKTTEQKLFYILFYIKCYPTFDLAGLIFNGVDRARTHEWTKVLLPVLKKAMKREIVLPRRKLSKLDEFFKQFPEVKEIWIDGTERPVQRPVNKEKQKEKYSGKKKRHTSKNLILSDKKKRILVVTGTVCGKEHDYTLMKKAKMPDKIPKKVKVWLDSGFQGVRKDYPDLSVRIPKRASRGHPLTEKDKSNNRKVSKKRVLVENAIGGIKRLRSLTDVYRNKMKNFEDDLMLVGAGLWNFHLKTS